jgi:integrase
VRQLVLVRERPPFLASPKTASSVRTVPLPTVVVDALALHLRDPPGLGEGFVFTNEHGEAIIRTRFSDRVWRPAVKRAGVEPATGFHALRHYDASLLIRHGESQVWRWRAGLYAGFCPGTRVPWAAIHLGRRLPAGSSGLPGT